MRVRAHEPLGNDTGRQGHAKDLAQQPNSNKKMFFFCKTVL
jgi:hypothetical protein